MLPGNSAVFECIILCFIDDTPCRHSMFGHESLHLREPGGNLHQQESDGLVTSWFRSTLETCERFSTHLMHVLSISQGSQRWLGYRNKCTEAMQVDAVTLPGNSAV
jgi:hypothetical protein